MAFNASITNISTSPASGCVAVGEPFTLNFRLNNTGTGIILLRYLYLYKDETFWELSPSQAAVHQLPFYDTVNIAAGKNKAYALTFPMEDPGFDGGRTAGCVLYAEVYHIESELTMTIETPLGISALDMRYASSIPAFAVRRDPTEESTDAAVDIRCSLAEGSDPEYEGLALTLKWKEEGETTFPSANTLSVTVADALATGGTTVSPSYVFEAGKAYTLRATFTDGIDAAFSETMLAKSFAVFDVSPDGCGFAVGQYSTGTEENPKFESAHPIIGYGGFFDGGGDELIPPVDYSTSRADTGQKWTDGKTIYRKVLTFGSISAGGTKDVTIGESAISTLVGIRGTLLYSGGAFPLPYADTSGGAYQFRVAVLSVASSPYVQIRTGSSVSSTGGFAVVEYTLS